MNDATSILKSKLKQRNFMFNLVSISLFVLVTSGTAFYSWGNLNPPNNIVLTILISFGMAMLMLEMIKKIHRMLEVNFLKEYWIEDCGNVLKLHGSVRAEHMHYAYRDILKVRPGFKIVENAFEKYGCTLAAIQATQMDLIAKKKIEDLGLEVSTIG
jgi:hypothetical protein